MLTSAIASVSSEPLSDTARPKSFLATRVVPCLDMNAGRVVKGVRFAGLRDAGDPVELAARYEQQGADELVLLDVSATPEGRGHAREVVAAVREVLSIPLTVGGGVRSPADAEALLCAGADKVAVNTAAVRSPALLDELAKRFGAQCTVLSLDAAGRLQGEGGWELVVMSGKERTGRCAIDWAREAAARGAGEILLTSFDRDGTRSGYDLPLIEAVAAAVRVPIVASGGAAKPAHFVEAARAGASAVLAASILHDGDYEIMELKMAMLDGEIEVRL